MGKARERFREAMEYDLSAMCDHLHACDCAKCVIHILNGNKAPGEDKPFEVNRGCDCFKDGKEALIFIRKHIWKLSTT